MASNCLKSASAILSPASLAIILLLIKDVCWSLLSLISILSLLSLISILSLLASSVTPIEKWLRNGYQLLNRVMNI
jgi:hypothetical protein